VLGRLLRDARIRSAALVDVDSGMLLDACTSDQARADLEVLGAGHAELVRVTLGVVPGPRGGLGRCEVVVDDGAGLHHVLRVVPEEDGALLALSVVVAGPERVVARVRRRLRRVSAAALTAGPSTARRPAATRWALGLSSFTTPVRTGPADAAPAGFGPSGTSADGVALPVVALPVVALPSSARGPDARDAATRATAPSDVEPCDPDRDAERWDVDGSEPPDVATLLFVKADPATGRPARLSARSGPRATRPSWGAGTAGRRACPPPCGCSRRRGWPPGSDTDRRPAPPSALPPGPHRG
jgi:hypothetical protein